MILPNKGFLFAVSFHSCCTSLTSEPDSLNLSLKSSIFSGSTSSSSLRATCIFQNNIFSIYFLLFLLLLVQIYKFIYQYQILLLFIFKCLQTFTNGVAYILVLEVILTIVVDNLEVPKMWL